MEYKITTDGVTHYTTIKTSLGTITGSLGTFNTGDIIDVSEIKQIECRKIATLSDGTYIIAQYKDLPIVIEPYKKKGKKKDA